MLDSWQYVVTRDVIGADNDLGAEGAMALAPGLAKLTQLNSLSLEMCVLD